MKQIIITLVFSTLAYALSAQTTLKGVVMDNEQNPVPNAAVIVTSNKSNKQKATMTNQKGEFTIEAEEGDKISISYVGYTFEQTTVTAEMLKDGFSVSLTDSDMKSVVVAAVGSVSPKSHWIGAKLGYNFDGFAEDDLDNYFVGAAKVVLNRSKAPFLGGEWGVIGNVAGFISNQNKEEADKDKEKLALSVQGLGLGLYQLWEKKINGAHFFRKYITTGYRLNTYKNVGEDSSTVNLSQFKLTGGLEFEVFEFTKGGALSISCELTHLQFSKNRYAKVFGESKSSLTSVEVCAIIPINETMGFFSSGTFAKDMKPVYLFGIIVRSENKK